MTKEVEDSMSAEVEANICADIVANIPEAYCFDGQNLRMG